MSSNFNKTLWEYGRKVEDKVLPIVNSLYDCDFKRNENDIYDILDFRDEEKKKIVEVKGRRILSTAYKQTLITASKITAGFSATTARATGLARSQTKTAGPLNIRGLRPPPP